MDYDWLPWIFTEGVIIRAACLNVKRIEHQGEQKSCLKTSSHCKKKKKKIKSLIFGDDVQLCELREDVRAAATYLQALWWIT